LASIFLYAGFSYINKIYTQPNLTRIISVYKGLPFPDKPGSDTMEIRGKIISRYIAVDKNTEWTTDDWKDFVNHMIRDGWTVEDKFMVHERIPERCYIRHLPKEMILSIHLMWKEAKDGIFGLYIIIACFKREYKLIFLYRAFMGSVDRILRTTWGQVLFLE